MPPRHQQQENHAETHVENGDDSTLKSNGNSKADTIDYQPTKETDPMMGAPKHIEHNL